MNGNSSVNNIDIKNDHREIGKKFNLFSFHEEGPGFAFFLENGLKIKNVLIDYWRKLHDSEGYSEIESPILLDRSLWEKSGHWDLFKDNMYVSKVNQREFAIKPMSCPGAILVYNEKRRSHNDLPLRISEMGRVHRNEDSGALHGLLRVRSFVQDDAHIFCERSSLEDEILKILKLSQSILHECGFSDLVYEIALRSDKKLKYLGADEDWAHAENALRSALCLHQCSFEEKAGEAKFYGPSIDIHIKDAEGRLWQCSSIQLDFNLAERFGLSYFDKNGIKLRPVILHRAIFGSLERFIGILLEHHGMNLPFWLQPEQLRIVPLKEQFQNEAKKLQRELVKDGLRVKVDESRLNFSSKIKKAIELKVPFVLCLGKNELEGEFYSIRHIGGEKHKCRKAELKSFLSQLSLEIGK